MADTRALSGDSQDFLQRSGVGAPFLGAASPDAAAEFLRLERSRLGTRGGVAALQEHMLAIPTSDHVIGDGVSARIYSPPELDANSPTVLYIHGGGWVSGGIEQHDSTCRILAASARAAVVNIDYRLAPEHPYPAALDDCDAALAWTVAAASSSLVPAGPIAVCGSSSGGNLAAALARRSARRGDGLVAAQVLLYPALDSRMSGASHQQNGSGYFVSYELMAWYWNQYRGTADLDDDPEFSPLAAGDLAGLPPALIVTAEFDLLRDDGARYATRLAEQGVPVTRQHHPGELHGFLGLLDDLREAAPSVAALGVAIGELLRGTLHPADDRHDKIAG